MLIAMPVDDIELRAGDDDVEMIGMYDETAVCRRFPDMKKCFPADPDLAVMPFLPSGGPGQPGIGIERNMGTIGQLVLGDLSVRGSQFAMPCYTDRHNDGAGQQQQ